MNKVESRRLQPCEARLLERHVVIIVQVVESDHLVTAIEQAQREMHPDETSRPRDQYYCHLTFPPRLPQHSRSLSDPFPVEPPPPPPSMSGNGPKPRSRYDPIACAVPQSAHHREHSDRLPEPPCRNAPKAASPGRRPPLWPPPVRRTRRPHEPHLASPRACLGG